MRVSDIMTTTVRAVSPSTTVDDALELLLTHRLTSLPVVAPGDGRVVGVVSEADVVRALVRRDPRAHARPVVDAAAEPQYVRQLMSSPAGTVTSRDDVQDVLERLAQHGWKSAPVVDGGRLVGVVSRSDVVRALHRPDDVLTAAVDEVLWDVGGVRWRVQVRDGVATITGPETAADRDVAERAARTVAGVRHVVVVDAPDHV